MSNASQDSCLTPGLKSVEQTISDLLMSLSVTQKTEKIAINSALDRILATTVTCPFDFPAWPASAMDGYAYAHQSVRETSTLRLNGQALAGHPYMARVAEGDCVRITTGAPLPEGTDTVVMQEHCQVAGQQVTLTKVPEAASNVRQIGSSIRAGSEILAQGSRLGPKELALLASAGVGEVAVYEPLRIAIFTTGDELVAPGMPLEQGQIFDSNRLAMVALCKRMGYEVLDFGLVADNPTAIKAVMLEAAKRSDVLLTSGGVSVGDADYIKPVLEEIGELNVWKVAIKPGKPIAIGRIGACHFFGLPGNPVSTLVTLDQLVLPALCKLSGQSPMPRAIFAARCVVDLRKSPGRRDYQRGIASVDAQGQWQVRSTGSQGSGRLQSMSDANCYIILEPECSDVEAGEMVNIELFGHCLSSH